MRGRPDGLLVDCGITACEVFYDRPYRFRAPPGGYDGVSDPDVRDYSRKPLAFLLGQIGAALVLPLAVLAAGSLSLMWPRRNMP